MNGNTALNTTIGNDSPTSIPTYAIVILVAGIVIIVVVILYFILRRYRSYEAKMARYRVKDNGLQDIIAERRRLGAD